MARSTKLKVVAALLLPAASPLAGQRPGWVQDAYSRPAIYGTVLDSASGRPLRGMALQVQGRQGVVLTDALGHYLLFGMPLGTPVVRIRCASLGADPPPLASRAVRVVPGTDSLVDFRVSAASCVEPRADTVSGIFDGVYTVGFEASIFEPCHPFADPSPSGGGRRWAWLVVSPLGRRQHPLWPDVPERGRVRTYYVRARGALIGPGNYGHLGSYPYELSVDRFLEILAEPPGSCRPAR
jgi:hypothetical protein